MRILPVLDLLGGRVVRGVAGKRDEYRPVKSLLIDGSDPLVIARAIRSSFGLSELYVADLDAILGRPANDRALRSLEVDGFACMVDGGIRRCEEADSILAAGARQVVAGLETLAGPDELRRLCRRWGPDRVVFSLDLRDGAPLGDPELWSGADPFGIARQAIDAGVTRLIVLDIARVGVGGGVTTLPLCGAIQDAFKDVAIITGGGVRDVNDLKRLKESGVDGVLIASALHDGSIGREALSAVA